MSNATWALLDVGICPECQGLEFLWTHSLADKIDDTAISKCRGCYISDLLTLRRNTSNYDQDGNFIPSPYEDDIQHLRSFMPSHDFMEQHERCDQCDFVITDNLTGRHATVEAYYADCTTIVRVHQRCSRTATCCDRIYISGWHGRSYVEFLRLDGFEDELCQHCFTKEIEQRGHTIDDYFCCNSCNHYVSREYRRRWRNGSYCDTCIEENLYTCDECGIQYWDGDGHDCEYNEEYDDGIIRDYGYKPRPFFFGKHNNPKERLYFGFELEVESMGDDRRDCAECVQNSLGERVYLKEDGSLNNGFEIVTHPHSLEEYQKNFDWSSFTTFRRIGLRSWDTSTCGLHVHVSRDAFGIPYDNRTDNFSEHIRSRQTHEMKFIKLIYDNERQVCRLAGRTSPNYANFEDKGNIVRKVKHDDTRGGRHAAVNTMNDSTLEVRIFKGSLRPERVLSAIEFVHAAVEYTRNLPVMGSKLSISNDGKFKSGTLSWLAFCSYIYANTEQYPHLFATLVKTFDNESPME